jgi:hypothetical protein
MINSLDRRDGAEEVSPPKRDDALARKRISAAIFTSLIYLWSNLSTFYFYFLLLCMPPTAMYAFYCYVCLSLPCMPPTAMHVRTFRQVTSARAVIIIILKIFITNYCSVSQANLISFLIKKYIGAAIIAKFLINTL